MRARCIAEPFSFWYLYNPFRSLPLPTQGMPVFAILFKSY